MKQYKFKYIKIAETKWLKIAILHFAEKFREIYKNKSKSKNAHKESMLHIYANNLIRNWKKKFYNNAMKSLISVCEKNKSPHKPKKKYTINDLSENDRGIYQEITENVLRRYEIVTPQLFLRAQKTKTRTRTTTKARTRKR
ncbi:hypothetical protein [Mesomycoplasma hyopneumoniae]|uniref:Uncharacterized protein n=1 Tax=Mesomycoplasma hyopneumoniae (strain 7448) TaxID=262722 RepID=A4Q7V4_MESH7|nr:hypothetical protein [Mesomycoplasma hyopneumoniae]ABP01101.1 hypothetical protein MHP7448_0683 [Mesomycoplasma hyopneumoniae 7448]AGQ50704.1 hypothetical protein MHL_0347 [Mesomycoplasma hyopneumoniae 7422]